MATPSTLQLSREQLSKMAQGDDRIARQLEVMISLTKFTAFGQSTVTDTLLDASGITYAASLPVGRFLVDALFMCDVTGGGGGVNGFVVNDTVSTSSPATIGAASISVVLSAGGSAGGAPVAHPGPYGVVDVSGALALRGFIEVQKAGVVGLTVTIAGAPATVTLLAGSGLTFTILREAP